MGRAPNPDRLPVHGVGPLVVMRLREIYPQLDDKELAARLLINSGTFSKWANDRAHPDTSTLVKLAALLNRHVTDLLVPDRAAPVLESAPTTAPQPVTSSVRPAADDVPTPNPDAQETLVSQFSALHPLIKVATTIVDMNPEIAGAMANLLRDGWVAELNRRGLHGRSAGGGSE